MKYFNWDKYKKELKENEVIYSTNVVPAIFTFTLFPYSSRNGNLEVYAVLFLMSLGMFLWPRYAKYIFHTRLHRALVSISFLVTSALGYGGYLAHGDLGYNPIYATYGVLDFLALLSMMVAFSTICHSLMTSKSKVDMGENY